MWTKGNENGEWELTETWTGGISEPSYHIGIPNHAHVSGHDNARLISLAPRMAETLISLVDNWRAMIDRQSSVYVRKTTLNLGEVDDLIKELQQMKQKQNGR